MPSNKFAVLCFGALLCCRTFSEPGKGNETSEVPVEMDASAAISSSTPVSRGERWEQYVFHRSRLARRDEVDLVFLGDSITYGWEDDGEVSKLWQERYVPRRAANFGIGGDRIENVLWRLDNGTIENMNPKLVVLLVGTNNLVEKRGLRATSAEGIADGIAEIVKRLRAQVPRSKILVLGILPRGRRAHHRHRATIAAANELIRESEDKQTVFFLDIGNRFLDEEGTIPEAVMSDALHLTPRGYRIWAEGMEETLCFLLGQVCNPGEMD